MNSIDNDLLDSIGFITRRSRLSFLTTLMTVTIVAAAIISASIEVSRLSQQVSGLKTEKAALDEEITNGKSVKARLAGQASQYRKGLRILVEANRDLFSHRYEQAIQKYKAFSETYGDSAESLNAYGYARLRWAISLKQQSLISNGAKKVELGYDARDQFAQASRLFDSASKADPSYDIPVYLAVLTAFYEGDTNDALKRTSIALNRFPSLLNSLCNDGQIKQLSLDKSALRELAAIAKPHAATLSNFECFFLN